MTSVRRVDKGQSALGFGVEFICVGRFANITFTIVGCEGCGDENLYDSRDGE